MHEFIVPSLLLYLRGVRQPAAEIGVRVRRRIAPPLHFHLAMAGRLCVHVY